MKKELSIERIKNTIDLNDAKRQRLFKQKEPIDAELNKLYNKNRSLREKIVEIKAKEKKTDWNWLLHCTQTEDTVAKSRLREEKLRKLNLSSSCYHPEIEQVIVRVSLVKGDPKSLELTLKGLKRIIPYIKPLRDGYKHIGIFEHDLAEHGVYELKVDEDKSTNDACEIVVTRHGRLSSVMCSYSLKKVLEYIQQHLYYETLDKDEEYARDEIYY